MSDPSTEAVPAPAPPEDALPSANAYRPEVHDAKVEAALLTTDRAISAGRLADLIQVEASGAIDEAVARLNAIYAETGRAFRIEALAGGYRIMTLPEHADVTQATQKLKPEGRLSPSALETLAVIAYQQPVLRAQIEAIRGVACGEVLRQLMARDLVKIVGRAEELGRPMLYGTTKQFLDQFGLASIKDLPEAQAALKETEA